MSTLLLSDLHLPPEPSPLREGFLRFLNGPARNAEAVYLLGDLYEVWIGDDRGLLDYGAEAAALKSLSATVPVFYMHGNRDFLLGRRYATAAGMTVLDDPFILDLQGVRTVLAHGDRYCIDDLAYQKWRRFSRRPLAQFVYRNLPQFVRARIAGGIRSTSLMQKRQMAEDIMDVNAAAIAEAFSEPKLTRMIHGHTHRPAEHRMDVGGVARERIVLADWRPQRMEYLEVTAQGYSRRLI